MQQELIATIAATSEALAVESCARVEMRKVIIPIESRTMLVRWTRKREIERNVSYEILRVLYTSKRERSKRLNGNSRRKQRYSSLSNSVRRKDIAYTHGSMNAARVWGHL